MCAFLFVFYVIALRFKLMKLIVFMVFFVSCQISFAGDLDDGIEIDEPINDDINLDINIQYIKRRAMAKTESIQGGEENQDKIIVNDSCGGTGNMNFGAGADLKGSTIVNMSDNRGSTTACGQ